MSIDSSIISRVLGVNIEFRNFNLGQAVYLPQRLGAVGQGRSDAVYSLDKFSAFSSSEVGNRVGFGSPLHLASKQLFPDNNDGIGGIPVTFYPLEDDGSGVVADGDITVTGTTEDTQSVGKVILGGIESEEFVSVVGETPTTLAVKIKAAIDAIIDMPALTGTLAAGVLPLTSKWAGESANDISIEIEFDSESALTIAGTAFTNGAVNPDVDDALGKIGEIWETFLLNCLNYDDTTSLDKYSVYNEGRWLQTVKKPLMVASGCVDDFATRTVITDARKSDRTNFLVQSNGSRELPFVIAARGLAKDIVPTANNKPATNYVGRLTGLKAGADSDQEDLLVRNQALKLGASTNIKVDEVAELNDTITMYHPTGETNPAYRYVVDIVKVQNILFNVELILAKLKGKPLAPDSTITADPDAVQPKNIIALFSTLADSLAGGRSMIIVEPTFTKENSTASIDSQNPKRLNSTFPVKLSGNVEVNSNDVFWGFNFGS